MLKGTEIAGYFPGLIFNYISGNLEAFLGSGAFCILKFIPFILIRVGFGFALCLR